MSFANNLFDDRPAPREAIAISSQPATRRMIADLLHMALEKLSSDQETARRQIEDAVALAVGAERSTSLVGTLAPWQVAKAKALIEDHLEQTIRITSIAAAVGLTPNYFSRVFKTSFDRPFSHYLIERRVERAKELLRDTNLPVCQIALVCGLSDQAHLSRVFRKIIGVSPAVWRRGVRTGGRAEGLEADASFGIVALP